MQLDDDSVASSLQSCREVEVVVCDKHTHKDCCSFAQNRAPDVEWSGVLNVFSFSVCETRPSLDAEQ